MTAQKLTQQRVHEIIEQYAAEHDGQIPSTTDIIILNDGRGSPSSANAYRKTYLALKQKPRSTPSDPMAGFPEAIAEAVKAMEASVKAEAQVEIDSLKGDLENREREWQEKLEAAEKNACDLKAEKSDVEDKLKLKRFEADTLREEITEQGKEIRSLALINQKLEGALAESRNLYAPLNAGLESLPASLDDSTASITALSKNIKESEVRQQDEIARLESQLEALGTDVKRTEDSRQGLITANTELSESISKHSMQYQAEIDRLNQLVDNLRQEKKLADLQNQDESMKAISTLSEKSDSITNRIESVEKILERFNAQVILLTKHLENTSQDGQGKDPSQ